MTSLRTAPTQTISTQTTSTQTRARPQQQTATKQDLLLKKRPLFELDVLRIVGVFFILYEHAQPYIGWDPRIPGIIPNPGAIGLTLFFLLSGFLLKRSTIVRARPFQAGAFLKSRLVRTLPLYWIAIASFVLAFHIYGLIHVRDFSPLLPTLITHAISAQLFLFPVLPEIFTLWYMGALIPYYALFAVTAKLKPATFWLVNIGVVLALLGIKLGLGHVDIHWLDTRLILFYPTFLLGAFHATQDINLNFIRQRKLDLFIVSSVLMLAFLQWRADSGVILDELYMLPTNAAFYVYSLLGGIALVSLTFLVSPYVRRFPNAIALLSASSYAIYLFHRPVYDVLYSILVALVPGTLVVKTLFFPIATGVVIAVAYGMTQLDAYVLKPFFTRLVAGQSSNSQHSNN